MKKINSFCLLHSALRHINAICSVIVYCFIAVEESLFCLYSSKTFFSAIILAVTFEVRDIQPNWHLNKESAQEEHVTISNPVLNPV